MFTSAEEERDYLKAQVDYLKKRYPNLVTDSERNNVHLVLNTVNQWTRKRDVSEAVLHSDQGFQYTSQAYNTRLEASASKAAALAKQPA